MVSIYLDSTKFISFLRKSSSVFSKRTYCRIDSSFKCKNEKTSNYSFELNECKISFLWRSCYYRLTYCSTKLLVLHFNQLLHCFQSHFQESLLCCLYSWDCFRLYHSKSSINLSLYKTTSTASQVFSNHIKKKMIGRFLNFFPTKSLHVCRGILSESQ